MIQFLVTVQGKDNKPSKPFVLGLDGIQTLLSMCNLYTKIELQVIDKPAPKPDFKAYAKSYAEKEADSFFEEDIVRDYEEQQDDNYNEY